jgi:hypothetical protein
MMAGQDWIQDLQMIMVRTTNASPHPCPAMDIPFAELAETTGTLGLALDSREC